MFFIRIFLSLSVFFLYTSYKPDEPSIRKSILLNAVFQTLSGGHFNPVSVDNDFSRKVFNLYLKRLDYSKRFLTIRDIEQLKKYESMIDDEFKNATSNFFDLSYTIINKRISDAEAYYKDILSHPFDFEKNETIELDMDKIMYAEDEKQLKELWIKQLKYQVMTRLDDLIEQQEQRTANNDTSQSVKPIDSLEFNARKSVFKNIDEWFKNMHGLDESDRFADYINTITNIYDPHTSYFPQDEKENFDISMSGRLEGIGAQLREQDGYIKVTNIVPGSASWRQGKLKEGDIILKVAQADAEPVDVVDMRLDHAVRLIRGKKGTEVRLTVKQKDGLITTISIIRDIVELKETYARSAILQSKNNKVGYIQLNKFYADFAQNGGRNSSDDVKKEIEKLKQDNAEAIILDLRSNSGGSLQDAVDMAGLFIRKGPIVQVRSREAFPYILADTDENIQFAGPLVVMVNSFSASASEILAAAIQDYQRGVIIGNAKTHGKGSVQRMINIDRLVPVEQRYITPLGSVKLTTQKFYRINGHSTQLDGMIPDIVLPDNYMYIDVGEKELDYPMQWDEIASVAYNKWTSPPDIQSLKKRSGERIKNTGAYGLIMESAMRLKEQRDSSISTLRLSTYREEQKKLTEEAKKYDGIFRVEKPRFEALSLSAENKDSTDIVRSETFQKNISTDIYLNEAVDIICDMLKK